MRGTSKATLGLIKIQNVPGGNLHTSKVYTLNQNNEKSSCLETNSIGNFVFC